jgi:acyl carrier protein
MSENVRDRIRGFIVEQFMTGMDPEVLEDDTSLERAHIVDSTRMLELILWVEETFGFEVQDEDAVPENFDSVRALVTYVEARRTA